MTAAAITSFQQGLIEVGTNWIKVLRLIKSIEDKLKQLQTLPSPKVG